VMRRVSAFLLLLCLPVVAQTPAIQTPADSPQTPANSSTQPAAMSQPAGSPANAGAQTPVENPPPPEQPHAQLSPLLSPQAAYDQASLPLDITRRDSANWSDVELAALDVAVAQAKDACVARESEKYTGGDLIGYARLCALGKEWPATYLAATTYINSPGPHPLLAYGYAYEVQADLNMGDEKAGEGACIAMLRSVPYTSLTDDVTSTTIRFLQFAYLPDALDLAFQREPYILDLIRAAQPTSATSKAAPAIPTPQPLYANPTEDMPLHMLFEHALILPELQQYNKSPERAAAEVADIDNAMPAALSPDEAIFIAADRRQYALLGTHFPALPGAVSLLPANETPPSQPHLGLSTIFLLFPPWCVQCIRQAKDIVPSLLREGIVSGSDDKLHIYALLADDPPPPSQASAKPAARAAPVAVHRPNQPGKSSPDKPDQPTVTVTEGKPATAEEQLRKSATLVVAPSTLADFNAADFPFLIAVDYKGIIRLMVPAAPKNALVQGGPAEQISDTILQHWPPFAVPPVPPAR
jgi:hypothetical protein